MPTQPSRSVATSARIRRWRHIQASAIDLFERHGFQEVSVDQVAEAAGVSRRTFFNYFATKADVLFDPDPTQAERLRGLLEDQGPGVDPWTALTEAVTSYLRLQERVVIARRRIIVSVPELDRHHVVANASFEDALREWLIVRGLDTFEARVVCALALAPVRVSFMSWDPDDEFDVLCDRMAVGFRIAARGAVPAEPKRAD